MLRKEHLLLIPITISIRCLVVRYDAALLLASLNAIASWKSIRVMAHQH